MGRDEKGEGGDRDDLGENKESQKGERTIKPVISLYDLAVDCGQKPQLSKMKGEWKLRKLNL